MNRPIRVWINRAGPSKVHAVKMLHENADGRRVHVVASRPVDGNGAVATVADEYRTEPDWNTPDEEYGQWAVDFARTYSIDVILPTCRIAALADRRGDFERNGTRLAVGVDPVGARVLDSKTATYETMGSVGLSYLVPEYHCIGDEHPGGKAVELRDAFFRLGKLSDGRMIVKTDTGWSADGFRILTRHPHRLDENGLFGAMGPIVDLEDYAQALIRYGSKKTVPNLIAMPYLTDEVSVDVLADKGEVLVMIPRTKEGRNRIFHASPEVMAMACDVVHKLKLDSLTNIQFRHLDGRPYLLEINPRGAAGLYHTAATGVNMYWETVKHALGEPVDITYVDLGARVQVLDFAVEM